MHPSGSEFRSRTSGSRGDLVGQFRYGRNKFRVFVGVRIRRVKTSDVGQKYEQVCICDDRNDRAERVVVSDGDLFRCDSIVFVDDRERVKLKKTVARVFEIRISLLVSEITARYEYLSDDVTVFRE